MIRSVTAVSILAFAVAIGLAPGTAAAKSDKTAKTAEKKPAEKDTKAGGERLDTFGDWTASLAKGKTKTCYALAKPKTRSPGGKADQAYIFIADRPAEKVRNEVSVILGFPIKPGSVVKARIGKTSFELVAGANAFFMKDAAEDAHVVEIMKRGGALIVEAIPAKGAPITDTYALTGFKPALDRAQKECR